MNDFWTYYAEHGAVIYGGYFPAGNVMAKGGTTAGEELLNQKIYLNGDYSISRILEIIRERKISPESYLVDYALLKKEVLSKATYLKGDYSIKRLLEIIKVGLESHKMIKTEQEITDDNKMIAKFMGAKKMVGVWYIPEHGELQSTRDDRAEHDSFETNEVFRDNELKYHSSWNWLMPVIRKINDEIWGKGDFHEIDSLMHETERYLFSGEIMYVWENAVKFVKWINEKNLEEERGYAGGGTTGSMSVQDIETKIEELKEAHNKIWTKSFEKEISPLIIQKAKEIAIKHPKLTKINVGMGSASMDGKISVLDDDTNKMVLAEYNDNDEEIEELLQLLSNLQQEDYGYSFDDIDLNKLRKGKMAGGGEAGEKKEFKYVAVSKNKSIRFDKSSYVLEYSEPNEHGLIKGKKLTYGYLTSSYRIGAPRGWFMSDISMTQDEFNKSYDLKEGTISVKIKMAGGGEAERLEDIVGLKQSLIGKLIYVQGKDRRGYHRTSTQKIVGIKEIEKDKIKLERDRLYKTSWFGLPNKVEETYFTLNELFDLSKGKVVNGIWLKTTVKKPVQRRLKKHFPSQQYLTDKEQFQKESKAFWDNVKWRAMKPALAFEGSVALADWKRKREDAGRVSAYRLVPFKSASFGIEKLDWSIGHKGDIYSAIKKAEQMIEEQFDKPSFDFLKIDIMREPEANSDEYWRLRGKSVKVASVSMNGIEQFTNF